jgi:hypothetical protein
VLCICALLANAARIALPTIAGDLRPFAFVCGGTTLPVLVRGVACIIMVHTMFTFGGQKNM